jgi:hypothetical protein
LDAAWISAETAISSESPSCACARPLSASMVFHPLSRGLPTHADSGGVTMLRLPCGLET